MPKPKPAPKGAKLSKAGAMRVMEKAKRMMGGC